MLSQINRGFFDSLKLYPPIWTATTGYAQGDLVKASTYNSHSYLCTTSGTSASVEPTFPIVNGNTVSDGGVVWTTYDTKTYQVIAPQTSSTPYVVFGLLTEAPIGDFADFEAVENLTYYINVFSDKSQADLATKADNVMDALDGASVTASGFTSMRTVREFIGSPVWDIETGIYMLPMRYRAWLDKT